MGGTISPNQIAGWASNYLERMHVNDIGIQPVSMTFEGLTFMGYVVADFPMSGSFPSLMLCLTQSLQKRHTSLSYKGTEYTSLCPYDIL